MVISPPSIETCADGFRLSARIESPKGPNGELWFEVENDPRTPLPGMATAALIAASLPVAGWIGEDLQALSLCEPHCLAAARTFARGFARLHRLPAIAVHAEAGSALDLEPRGVASSFSGGIDSFYTLLNHPEIDVLVTGLGFDTRPDDYPRLEMVRTWTRQVADETGKRCIFVRSNFRALFDPYAPWYEATHGALLTAYAFVLSSIVDTYLLPSSACIDQLVATGSHALLDAAWSRAPTEIVNDGWEAHRNDKLQAIGADPLVRKALRVCARPSDGRNCGRCFKCLKTLVAMAIYCIPVPETFPSEPTAEQIRRMRIKTWRDVARFQTLQADARQNPNSVWMARPLGVAIFRGRCRMVRHGLVKKLRARR